jgi:hypothetical protein
MKAQPAAPALPCPGCGTAIPVDIGALVQTGRVGCPSCALVLEVDRPGSRKAFAALERWYLGMQEATEIVQRAMPPRRA